MKWIFLLGRVLFGGFFVMSSVHHFTDLDTLAGYAAAHGVGAPHAAVFFTGVLMLLGGLSVLLGFTPRIGAVLLLLFLVPVTPIMHGFWAEPNAQQQMLQMGNFMRNVAFTGAALTLMAIPLPWPVSLDELIHRKWPAWERWTGFIPPAIPH